MPRHGTWLAGLGLGLLVCAPALAQATPPAVQREWQLVRGAVAAEQRLIQVRKGDSVALRIGSDSPGELHLHAYRLVVGVVPGQMAKLDFKAHATGRFRFEWHPASLPAEGSAEPHHAPPVAVLEVRPP